MSSPTSCAGGTRNSSGRSFYSFREVFLTPTTRNTKTTSYQNKHTRTSSCTKYQKNRATLESPPPCRAVSSRRPSHAVSQKNNLPVTQRDFEKKLQTRRTTLACTENAWEKTNKHGDNSKSQLSDADTRRSRGFPPTKKTQNTRQSLVLVFPLPQPPHTDPSNLRQSLIPNEPM